MANHAESGESLRGFRGGRRLEKILSQIRPGDYLQFDHNDQKPGTHYVEPHTTYKEDLAKFVAAAHDRKAIPVLVTPMNRRRFGPDGKIFARATCRWRRTSRRT